MTDEELLEDLEFTINWYYPELKNKPKPSRMQEVVDILKDNSVINLIGAVFLIPLAAIICILMSLFMFLRDVFRN